MNYRIAGWIFITVGVLSIGTIISDAFHHKLYINFLALMLPVGIGLLKGKASSRIWGIRWMWVMIVISLFASVLVFIGNWEINGNQFKASMGFRSFASIVCIAIALMAFSLKNWLVNNPIK